MKGTATVFFNALQPGVRLAVKARQEGVAQWESLVALQMNSLRAYVDLGLAQYRVAAQISSPQDLCEALDSQIAVFSFLGHRLQDDSRALLEWQQSTLARSYALWRAGLIALIFRY